MGWNGLDLINDFSAELGDVSNSFKTKVLRWINEGIRDIATSHQWPFLREKGQVLLVADSDTHLVALARPSAPDVAALTAGALTDATAYKVLVTFYEDWSGAESIAGDESDVITTADPDLGITVSNIPISTSPLVTSRKIYVSKSGGAFQYHGVINNNLLAIPATFSELVSQGITYTALVAAADFITVEVLDTASGGLTYSEIGGEIIIDLGGDTPSVDDVVALLAGSAYVEATGTGAALVVVAAQEPLVGGLDLTPVTYTILSEATSPITPPEDNAIHMIDGDFYIEGDRSLVGTSVQNLVYQTSAASSSGTPSHWAPVNQEEIMIYPTPSEDVVSSFFYFKLPAKVFGINTSVPQIPSWLYEDLRRYVIWRGYEFRDRAGKESKQLNYENGLRITISRRGKALKKSGKIRSVTFDSDGVLS